MNKKIKISASIMCANWLHLEKDIRELEAANIDYIHYDLMDGFFVPDYCLGTYIIGVIQKNTRLPSEYHLMVEEPIRIIKNFVPKNSEDILSIHYEACRNLHRDLINIKQMGFKVGVVLNPATGLHNIEYVIEEVDLISIMTVNPGYPGQKFVPQMLTKIERLQQLREKQQFNFEIEVDGNVSVENTPKFVAAGVDILVAGSSGIFKDGKSPLKENIDEFKTSIEEGLKMRKGTT